MIIRTSLMSQKQQKLASQITNAFVCVNGGSYSFKSIPNDRFLRKSSWQFYYQMLNEIEARNSVEQSDGFHDGITNIFDVFDESETAKPSFSHHQFFCVRVSGGFYSFKSIPKDRFLRKSSWQF